MAICPFADTKLIPAGSNDPRLDVVVGAVCHVAVSEATSLFDYFKNRSGGIESHFYITLTGRIEQYRDTQYEADAQLNGNSFSRNGKVAGYVSIETAGMGGGKWNSKQLAALRRLLLWLAETHDFPLSKCTTPTDPGVGYHTMWGAPSAWTPVAKSCPGPERIKQFDADLVMWMRKVQREREHPLAPTRVSEAREDLEALIKLLKAAKNAADGPGRTGKIDVALAYLEEALTALPPR